MLDSRAESVPSIMLCLPQRDEVKAGFSMALSHMSFWNARNLKANVYVSEQRGAMISGQRNDLVTKGLEFGVEWFMWIDSDMSFPPDTLVSLMRHNKPIVGATYNKRVPPYETLGHFLREDLDQDLSKGGLVRADFMPGGLMLVKASVYRALRYPWYFETYKWEGSSPIDSFLAMMKDWSNVDVPDSVLRSFYEAKGIREWLSDNEPPAWMGKKRTMSEDYNFCRKVLKHGFEIWCDLDLTYACKHIGETVVSCDRPPAGTTVRKALEQENA